MGVKVASGCLNWSQSSIVNSQTLAAISSPSSKRRSFTDVSLVCRHIHRSNLFGTKLNRSRSCESLKLSKVQHSLKRTASANFDSEFLKEVDHESSIRFHLSDDEKPSSSDNQESEIQNSSQFADRQSASWSRDMIPGSIERKANSLDLPFSLRIIQKKKQWEGGVKGAKDCTYSSIKKAFSTMVFIIRELQSYTLQMREVLYLEDLQEILIRVQKEMNASFVWLFQQVFSHTPILMVHVMILLANYSVYSMSNNVALAAPPLSSIVETESTVSMMEKQKDEKFDFSSIRTFFVDSGGINGGGGKPRPVTSGTDDGEESVSGQVNGVEEWGLWKSMVVEAEKMDRMKGNEGIDRETMQRFVSPVMVKIEEDVDADDYLKTEIVYQMGLAKEPNNPLLLANYAQFLYLFAHDHKRAETYFKRASEIEPKDAEALSKYASFLWQAKNDLWAAEETFLEAISADPNNSFYAASYAHFLWSNGAEDTCFPLESP
ncbi:uncharacterized protein [Rutidosis leptorrhynchoides]|uniref:uncharacterized protein n=1 Tax=Rutidosis leptorrhynchoides TaxID=125765 RepID=UPI003A9A649E